MNKFIARQNVERFRRLIMYETNPRQRLLLEQMLADEETKLRTSSGFVDGEIFSHRRHPGSGEPEIGF